MSVEAFEAIIGYNFGKIELLEQALTHSSLKRDKSGIEDNQRLEFLGDAVIELILTDMLFRRFPQQQEGKLTQWRSELVSRKGLAELAHSIKLGKYIKLSRGEEAEGGRQRSSILADAFEALLGAIYLDSGFEIAQAWLSALVAPRLEEVTSQEQEANVKGRLQEELQKLAPVSPLYEVISEEGPDHNKCFEVRIVWQGKVLSRGMGSNKQLAEKNAAKVALDARNWEMSE